MTFGLWILKNQRLFILLNTNADSIEKMLENVDWSANLKLQSKAFDVLATHRIGETRMVIVRAAAPAGLAP